VRDLFRTVKERPPFRYVRHRGLVTVLKLVQIHCAGPEDPIAIKLRNRDLFHPVVSQSEVSVGFNSHSFAAFEQVKALDLLMTEAPEPDNAYDVTSKV
jgi:hypothetical protein